MRQDSAEGKRKSMISTGIIISVMIIALLPAVQGSLLSSGDVTFTLDQKEYYFKTGENAVIPLDIDNTYGEQVNGMLTYTYSQEINQGGMRMSTSNSQSVSLSVDKGESTQGMNFGTSDTPLKLDINLKFTYTDPDKKSRVVEMKGITVYFVSDENQKKNQQQQQSSSSQKNTQTQQAQNNQQDPFAQMQQQLNKMMNGDQQQQQPQNNQQALQNNQMAQDSSALKKQMEQQVKEQQEMEKEFQKQIAKNHEFQKEHQKLTKQGYNVTGQNLNPTTNNTGDFEIKYQNPEGEQATIKGKMQDGEMKELQKDTPETRKQAMDTLQQDKRFQEYQKQLQDQGYTPKDTEINQEQETTKVNVNYQGPNNQTATIKSEIENNTVQKIELEQEGQKEKSFNWWIPIIILLLLIAGYLLYTKLQKKGKKEDANKTNSKKPEKPFDYKAESRKLLAKSKKYFEEKKFKQAYGTAGQALRMYLSYENTLNKETTNDEIISYLRKHKKSYKEAKECFDLCSLVQFAKYEANRKDFNKIVKKAEKVMEE